MCGICLLIHRCKFLWCKSDDTSTSVAQNNKIGSIDTTENRDFPHWGIYGCVSNMWTRPSSRVYVRWCGSLGIPPLGYLIRAILILYLAVEDLGWSFLLHQHKFYFRGQCNKLLLETSLQKFVCILFLQFLEPLALCTSIQVKHQCKGENTFLNHFLFLHITAWFLRYRFVHDYEWSIRSL